MISFDWRFGDKRGRGTVEDVYGLAGYATLIRDELAGLDSQITAAELPARAFARAASSAGFEVEGVSGEAGPCDPSSCIDLRRRLESPVVAGPGKRSWHALVAKVIRRLRGRPRRPESEAGANGPSGRSSAFVVTTREALSNGSGDIAGSSPRVYLSGNEHLPKRTGLRVPQIDWNNRSLQRLLAFDIASVADPLIRADALAPEDEKLLATPRGFRVVGMPKEPPAGAGALPGRDVQTPLVSVVIVSYNQREFLEAAILSVLEQDHPRVELIVVDGASTDGSVEILERYRDRIAKLIIEKDRGQSDALNKGFTHARGEICNWLCSDDLLVPGALSAVAAAWTRSGADMILGGCRVIDSAGQILRLHHSGFPLEEVHPLSFGDLVSFHSVWQGGHYFYQPEVYFSRDLWQRSGGFIREDLYYAMDYEMYLRFALASATVYHVPTFVGCSRVHDSQKTRHEIPEYLPTVRKIVRDYDALVKAVAGLAETTPATAGTTTARVDR